MAPEPLRLSIAQAAEHIGVSRDTIRRRIADGTLPAYRIGRGQRAPIRIAATDLDALLQPVPTAGRPLTAPAAAGRSR